MPDDADDPKRISANPARRFFVAMLVKDIELVPAILDLVDNSIDGAKRLRPPTASSANEPREPGDESTRFKGLQVRIIVNAERFEIDDNCGGIPLAAARDYAFRFGRPSAVEGPLGEVGQFGVGMKRALFKLGTYFEVASMTRHDSFLLPVDVSKWSGDDEKDGEDTDWSFNLRDFEQNLDLPEEDTGTNIFVSPLHTAISQETGDPTFPGRLLEELRLRHSEAVRQGLRLEVNGVEVDSFQPALLRGEGFEPIHVEREVRAPGGGMLHMRLYAGLVRTGDEGVDDENAEDFRAPPEAGWYLYCNERLLLAGHTGRLTGWGEAAAAYHPQFRQFRGYVWLDGDAALMPWTTTKTSVDEDSTVFRAVQAQMFDALQKAQGALNRLSRELRADVDERPAVDAMSSATLTALSAIPPSERFVLPPAAPRTPSTVRNITYQVDRDDFDLVAAEVGTTTAAEIGRRTFEFFLDTQVSR